jgi:hypothetical protein
VETREPELAHWAINRCLSSTKFAKVVLITNLDRVQTKKADIEYVQAPPIKTTKDYSELLLTGINQYVETSHVLIIQWDSFVTHPELWSDEFLRYDYIGPVWPHHPETPVGNGGFSLRSKRLLDAIQQPGFVKKHPEDYCICADNKDFLERHDIKIAPPDIAEQFAVERSTWHDAFGFHGFFNFGRVLNDGELKTYINLLPENYLSGLDVYNLIEQLKESGRFEVAQKTASKLSFKWKMRRRYFKLKIALLFKLEFYKKLMKAYWQKYP